MYSVVYWIWRISHTYKFFCFFFILQEHPNKENVFQIDFARKNLNILFTNAIYLFAYFLSQSMQVHTNLLSTGWVSCETVATKFNNLNIFAKQKRNKIKFFLFLKKKTSNENFYVKYNIIENWDKCTRWKHKVLQWVSVLVLSKIDVNNS